MFANIGLILSMYYPQGIKFNLLFLLAIGFNMIFGVLAMPSYTHLLGLFAFSTLFNIYSIDFAVQKGFLKRFKWI